MKYLTLTILVLTTACGKAPSVSDPAITAKDLKPIVYAADPRCGAVGGGIYVWSNDSNDNHIVDSGDSQILSNLVCNGVGNSVDNVQPAQAINVCGDLEVFVTWDGVALISQQIIPDGTYDLDCQFTISTAGSTRTLTGPNGSTSWSL